MRSTRVNWDVLDREMDAAGIDVIVAACLENFFYLTDVYVISHVIIPERLGLAVVPRHGEAAALVCRAEVVQTRAETWMSEVEAYVEFQETPMHALAVLLRSRGLGGARVGIESRFLAAGYVEELKGHLPDLTIVPADDALQRARSIKTAPEIEQLRLGATATERAILEAFQRARPGDTEKSLSDAIGTAMVGAGAMFPWVVLGSGDRTAINHPAGGEKRLTQGEIVRVDVGGVFGGYQSDIARTAAIGEPTPETTSVYRKLREVHTEAIAAVMPGACASDVYEAARGALDRRGFIMRAQAVGHGLGTGLHDYPMLRAGEPGELRAGMVLSVEPAARNEQGWIFHHEDTMLLTEQGPELFTGVDDGDRLVVIG